MSKPPILRRHAWRALLVAGAFSLAPTAAQAATAHTARRVPTLGSPTYLPDGGIGYGHTRPKKIFNGGVPSGLITHIRWRTWGGKVSYATGRKPQYRPQGGYFPTPVKVQLRAQDIGQCAGQSRPAYLHLYIREAQWPGGPLGPWAKWNVSKDLCKYAHFSVTRPRGYCKDLNATVINGVTYYDAEVVFSIEAYRMSCRSARAAGREVQRFPYTPDCQRHGCSATVKGFRCRLGRLDARNTTPDFDDPRPVLSVACRRRHGVMTAWFRPW